MWDSLSQLLIKRAQSLLVIWVLIILVCWVWGPTESPQPFSVNQYHLPQDAPSVQAEQLFRESFDRDFLRNLVVVCARRPSRLDGLTTDDEFQQLGVKNLSDFKFIEDVLTPQLQNILNSALESHTAEVQISRNLKVRDFTDGTLGPLLISEDQKATLVLVELPDQPQIVNDVIDGIESLIYESTNFIGKIPPGLELSLGGSATLSQDYLKAIQLSETRWWYSCITLNIFVILIVGRAHILMSLPFLSTLISLPILDLVIESQNPQILIDCPMFPTLVKSIMITMGTGWGILLITHYRQSLMESGHLGQALRHALRQMLPSSCGFIVLCLISSTSISLTNYGQTHAFIWGTCFACIMANAINILFLPGILQQLGNFALWPYVPQETPTDRTSWLAVQSMLARSELTHWFQWLWRGLAQLIYFHTKHVLIGGFSLLFLLAIWGSFYVTSIEFSHRQELPEDTRSLIALHGVRDHFPDGVLSQTSMLITNDQLNFLQSDGISKVRQLCQALFAQRWDRELVDIRSVAFPLGMTPQANDMRSILDSILANQSLSPPQMALRARVINQYVGRRGPHAKQVTRIDFIFNVPAESAEAKLKMDVMEQEIQSMVAQELPGHTNLFVLGETASLRDLNQFYFDDQFVLVSFAGAVLFVYILIVRMSWQDALYQLFNIMCMLLSVIGFVSLLRLSSIFSNESVLFFRTDLLSWYILMLCGGGVLIEILRRFHQPIMPPASCSARGFIQSYSDQFMMTFPAVAVVLANSAAFLLSPLEGVRVFSMTLSFGFLILWIIQGMVLVPALELLKQRNEWPAWMGISGITQNASSQAA